jgi:predicted nucleotide-binding protein (sugar kinase/HSP70/actin superfamily)
LRKGEERKKQDNIPNMFQYKNERIFSYEPIENQLQDALLYSRVLNMYEKLSFWAVFSRVGFRIVLSPNPTSYMN